MPLRFADLQRESLTPMMQQYLAVKDERPDCLLFFRLGDFYELFFDDALIASEALGLTLTHRDCGLEDRAPMCGVPYHALEQYLRRLVEQNYKIAICEQLEDPKSVKGIVKRGVIRVVTPGTLSEAEALDAQRYSFLVSVFQLDQYYGLAACDLSCGRFECCELLYGDCLAKLKDELARFQPVELVSNKFFAGSAEGQKLLQELNISHSVLPDNNFSLEQASRYPALPREEGLWARASAGLLSYLEDTQQCLPQNLSQIQPYSHENYLILDQNARRHLELTATMREQKRHGSLLWAMDRCKSSMGSRLLRHWLEQPLIEQAAIECRQSAIQDFLDHFLERQNLRESLAGLYDLERLAGKLAISACTARDLKALSYLLGQLPEIREKLSAFSDPQIVQLREAVDPHEAIAALIDSTLVDEPPLGLKEGALIREGVHAELDHLREAASGGRSWLLELERRERESTGIKNLKVRYNRVFGYAIEVSKSQTNLVPEHYIRRQTLANAERYVTEELKQMESEILGAESRQVILEYDLFCELRSRVEACQSSLHQTAQALAELDVLSALAELAARERYCRPVFRTEPCLYLTGARHPVVEQRLKHESFVPNDLELSASEAIMVLTGPNMSGKSTYMRQSALICIMAQMGSFVPAESCEIGICDRIFTRVGAADDLGAGQSTFMVEMREVADILQQMSRRSLLILDEIGRGTSTYDGLAIAWAIVESLSSSEGSRCRCLFATHYHELTDLEGRIPGVFNRHIEVTTEGEQIRFLHHIRKGGCDDSYGIDVAKLAGVPDPVVRRAREILHNLEQSNQGKRLNLRRQKPMEGQLDLISLTQAMKEDDELKARLRALDINTMRPLDALATLAELQAMLTQERS